jgi:hypothetical protein
MQVESPQASSGGNGGAIDPATQPGAPTRRKRKRPVRRPADRRP